MAETYLTKEGYEALLKKVERLQTVSRAEISEKIKAAREFGDLSENAEYDAAKEEQANVENEIKELNEIIANVVIIDDMKQDAKAVGLGSTVKIQNEATGEKYEFRVVGFAEADCLENKIANDSPLGAALMGKRKGMSVNVVSPDGAASYRVVNIIQ